MVVSIGVIGVGFSVVLWRSSTIAAILPWVVWGAVMGSVVIHELGHLVVGRVFGARVNEVYLGAEPGKSGQCGVQMGVVTVYFGWRVAGRVVWGIQPRRGGGWLTFAAGPVANLGSAAGVLVLPLPPVVLAALAGPAVWLGIGNLVPYRHKNGMYTDGAHMFGLAAGWKVGVAAKTARVDTRKLLLPKPKSSLTATDLVGTVQMACWLALSRSVISADELELAGRRVAWLAENAPRTPQLVRVMALCRLREGRYAEAAELCREALGGELTPDERASVHAIEGLAARARSVGDGVGGGYDVGGQGFEGGGGEVGVGAGDDRGGDARAREEGGGYRDDGIVVG